MRLLLSLLVAFIAFDLTAKPSPFVLDHTNHLLGEAYRTPDGVVWGDALLSDDRVQYRKFEIAQKYCKQIGAELPKESDFENLREQIKTANGSDAASYEWNNYLPHLTYRCQMSERFFSGKARHYDGDCSYEFWTAEGKYIQIYGSGTSPVLNQDRSVRCIRRPNGNYKKIHHSDLIVHDSHRARPILGTLGEVTEEGARIITAIRYDGEVLEGNIVQSKSTHVVDLECKTDLCKEQISKIPKGEKVLVACAGANKDGYKLLAKAVYRLKELNLITSNSYESYGRKPVELRIKSNDPVVVFMKSYERIPFVLTGDREQFVAAFVQGQYHSEFEGFSSLSINSERVFPGASSDKDVLDSFGVSWFDFKKGKSFTDYALPNRLRAEF